MDLPIPFQTASPHARFFDPPGRRRTRESVLEPVASHLHNSVCIDSVRGSSAFSRLKRLRITVTVPCGVTTSLSPWRSP
jgi:hypothetical protein